MMPEMKKPEASVPPIKYPIRCVECGGRAVVPQVIPHRVIKTHDGRRYELEIPALKVTRCEKCGEIYFAMDSDKQIAAALRARLDLLTPEQIRNNIASLRMSQKEFAERIGVAAESVSRWISGALIQSKAMDNLMRTFFACPDARRNLSGSTRDPAFGRQVVGTG